MNGRVRTAMGLGTILASAAIGLAGPAAAAPATAWPMPDMRGQTLARAQDMVYSFSSSTEFRIRTLDGAGLSRQQLNPTNWIVCRQSPGAGGVLRANKENVARVTFVVRRPSSELRFNQCG